MVIKRRTLQIDKYLVSEFPDHLIERILFYLPITKVYAISKFCERFRDSWRYCHDVCFDKKFQKMFGDVDLMKIISDIIMGHSGQGARCFELCLKVTVINEELVNIWIKRAVDLGFKEICLNFTQSRRPVVLKKGIFLVSNNLTRLNLSKCFPNLPVEPSSPLHVLELTLQRISISQDLVQSILINCKSLQVLKLIRCHSPQHIYIHAQGLQRLRELVFEECCFADLGGFGVYLNAPSVKWLRFYNKGRRVQFQRTKSTSDINSNMIAQSNILMNDNWFMHMWIATTLLLNQHVSSERFAVHRLINSEQLFQSFEEFHFHAHPKAAMNPFCIPIFLLRCPLIKKVFIDLDVGSVVENDESPETFKCINTAPVKLRNLNFVRMSGMKNTKIYMCLVKMIIEISTSELQSLILVKAKGESDFSMDKLACFKEILPTLNIHCLSFEETRRNGKIASSRYPAPLNGKDLVPF